MHKIAKQVQTIYDSYPVKIRRNLLKVREIIYSVALENEEIGAIEETLKWGEPSYLTHSPKSGTTIRLGTVKNSKTEFSISVHCQTSLISDFKILHPELNYEKNRSLIFSTDTAVPFQTIRLFIYLALRYHLKN